MISPFLNEYVFDNNLLTKLLLHKKYFIVISERSNTFEITKVKERKSQKNVLILMIEMMP